MGVASLPPKRNIYLEPLRASKDTQWNKYKRSLLGNYIIFNGYFNGGSRYLNCIHHLQMPVKLSAENNISRGAARWEQPQPMELQREGPGARFWIALVKQRTGQCPVMSSVHFPKLPGDSHSSHCFQIERSYSERGREREREIDFQ